MSGILYLSVPTGEKSGEFIYYTSITLNISSQYLDQLNLSQVQENFKITNWSISCMMEILLISLCGYLYNYLVYLTGLTKDAVYRLVFCFSILSF